MMYDGVMAREFGDYGRNVEPAVAVRRRDFREFFQHVEFERFFVSLQADINREIAYSFLFK